MSNAKKGAMKVVLFVCTGNTCRSPMAERMAKRWLASEFKVKESELERKAGIRIESGGLSKTPEAEDEEARKNSSNPHDSPASTHGITVMKNRGYDTTDHRSRILTKTDVAKAFRIYCVSKSHKEKILKYPTACPDRVYTLGMDIPDPYGGKIEDYERCAATLEKVIPEVLKRDMKFFTATSPPSPPPTTMTDVSKYSNGCDWIRPKETAYVVFRHYQTKIFSLTLHKTQERGRKGHLQCDNDFGKYKLLSSLHTRWTSHCTSQVTSINSTQV